MFVLFDAQIGKTIGDARKDRYTVDGKPGEIPEHWVELEIVENTVAQLAIGQSLEFTDSIDLENRILNRTWVVVEPPSEVAELIAGQQKQSSTDQVYSALPIAAQAAFAPLYVAVKDFLSRGKKDVAYAIVYAQPVPPELQSVKDELLLRLQ